MSYDIHTPFGVMPGQVSPAEQMASDRMLQLRKQASDEDAQSAYIHALKDLHTSTEGGGGGNAAPAPTPAPTPAPADGGGVVYAPDRAWMAARSGRDAADAANELAAAKSRAEMEGPVQASRDADTEEAYLKRDQARRADTAGNQLDQMLGLNGGGQVGGGGAGAGAQKGTSDDDLMRMAILGSIAGGKGAPDIGGFLKQRSDAAAAKQKMDYDAQVQKIALQDAADERATKRSKAAQDSGDQASAVAIAKTGNVPVPTADYGAVTPQIRDQLTRVHEFIRQHNWDIASHSDELGNLYNQTLQRLMLLHPSPQAQQLVVQDLKNTMRDALQQNGVFFESSGSDAVRGNYGL